MKFKKFICLLILTSLVLSTGITASARTPYANYYIQEKEKTAKPIPAAYETSTVIDFLSTETGKLKNPEDMFIDEEGKIYVLKIVDKLFLEKTFLISLLFLSLWG